MPQLKPSTAKHFFFKFHSPGPALSHPASSSTFSLQQVCNLVAQYHFLSQCYVFSLFSYVPCSAISSVAQSCPTLCDPMDCSVPGLPVHHQLPEFTQTHMLWVSEAIQPSHPLSSPSPSALNFSQQQGLFQWVSSLHQVVKVLEFQIQHQSFQWIFMTDFL